MFFKLELHPYEWLRVMRSRLEMTQSALAKRLGVERRTVLRWEGAVCKILKAQIERIKRLAALIQVGGDEAQDVVPPEEEAA